MLAVVIAHDRAKGWGAKGWGAKGWGAKYWASD
jgi:hypothetical protein